MAPCWAVYILCTEVAISLDVAAALLTIGHPYTAGVVWAAVAVRQSTIATHSSASSSGNTLALMSAELLLPLTQCDIGDGLVVMTHQLVTVRTMHRPLSRWNVALISRGLHIN